MPTSKKPSQRPRHSTPTISSCPSASSRSPLPKTPWTGPWQRRQTTRTTRPCQTRRSLRSSICRQLWHPHPRRRTCSAASLCAPCTALDRAESKQKCTTIIISHCALCCLTCPLSRVSRLSVVSRVRCPVCLCSVCPAQAPRLTNLVFFFAKASKSADTR